MIQQRNSGASILRNIDWITVLLYLLMVAAGVVSIYAASYDFDQANMFSADEFSGKQVRWIGPRNFAYRQPHVRNIRLSDICGGDATVAYNAICGTRHKRLTFMDFIRFNEPAAG